MKNEVIIKREGGMQLKIVVDVYLDTYINNIAKYRCELYIREKGKRKWLKPEMSMPEYQFRKLSMEGRRKEVENNILRFVSEEELYQAKLSLWALMKPLKQNA